MHKWHSRSVMFRPALLALLIAAVWACAPPGVSNSVKIGKSTHVCVTINNVTQAYFTPVADKLSRLTLNGCKSLVRGGGRAGRHPKPLLVPALSPFWWWRPRRALPPASFWMSAQTLPSPLAQPTPCSTPALWASSNKMWDW